MGFIRSFRRQMSRQMKQREIAAEKRRCKVRFEPLEPRLLLSADLNQGAGEMIPDMLDALDLRTESLQTGLTDRSQRSFIDMHGDINDEAIKNELGQITAEQTEGVAQLIFVDPAVHDHEILIEGFMHRNGSDSQVVLLDSDLDGMQQITEALTFYDGVESLHILSHGSSGNLTLGNTSLTTDTIGTYTPQLTAWSDALGEDADILLYGCNVAEGAAGIGFVQNLSKITGADVAASDDLTGNPALGGDWDLEFATGRIQAESIPGTSGVQDYRYVLKDIYVINDIKDEDLNPDGGPHTYKFQVKPANDWAEKTITATGDHTLDFSTLDNNFVFEITGIKKVKVKLGEDVVVKVGGGRQH